MKFFSQNIQDKSWLGQSTQRKNSTQKCSGTPCSLIFFVPSITHNLGECPINVIQVILIWPEVLVVYIVDGLQKLSISNNRGSTINEKISRQGNKGVKVHYALFSKCSFPAHFILFRTLDISAWLSLIFDFVISFSTSRFVIRNMRFSKSDSCQNSFARFPVPPGVECFPELVCVSAQFQRPFWFSWFTIRGVRDIRRFGSTWLLTLTLNYFCHRTCLWSFTCRGGRFWTRNLFGNRC